MDISQLFSADNTLLLVLGCVCLCGLGFLLVTGIGIIGGFLDTIFSIFNVFFDILAGGPTSWCGCLVVIVLCAGGVGLALLMAQALSTCGTPQAINFCSILGR